MFYENNCMMSVKLFFKCCSYCVNCCSLLYLQEEGEVASDQSLKEFEGATLRYASINLKYVLLKRY